MALTHANGPSVIQVRTQDVMPVHLGNTIIDVLQRYQPQLESGALITVDEHKSRVRILPI